MLRNIIFLVIAILSSIFCATYSYELHDSKEEADKKKQADSKIRRVHQFVLHLLGALVGWLLLYYLLFIKINFLDIDIGWEDLLIFLISLIGITGYLPYNLIIKNWIPGR